MCEVCGLASFGNGCFRAYDNGNWHNPKPGCRLNRARGNLWVWGACCGSFRKLGVPCFGVLLMRVLLFRVLY